MNKEKTIRFLSITSLVIGLFFLSGYSWGDKLSGCIPCIYGFQIVGQFFGIPLVLLGLFGTIVTRSFFVGTVFQRHRHSFASLGVSALANALVLAYLVQFLSVPTGSHVRLMILAGWMFIIGGWTWLIAVPTGIVAIVKERPRSLGILSLGVALGINPFVFSSFMLSLIARIRGFSISP